jgi:inosine/xanthosine triphosphate pyrophosphatase family protein
MMSLLSGRDFKFVSSNPRKIREFAALKTFGIGIEQGRDLAEVMGTPDEVIVYKAIAAGPNRIVEDSILMVGGETIVDARFRIGDVGSWIDQPGAWEVRIGINVDGQVLVYRGVVEGVYGPPQGSGEDYDPFFHIPIERKSLAELNTEGRKSEFSARHRAIQALIKNDVFCRYDIASYPEWVGDYQH